MVESVRLWFPALCVCGDESGLDDMKEERVWD